MKKVTGSYWPVIRDVMLGLPGVKEGTSYGTPAFHVNKKMLARMKEDNKTLVVYTPDRDIWTAQDDLSFFITDHYRDHPYVLVDLARVKKPVLASLLTEAWRSRAGTKYLKQAIG